MKKSLELSRDFLLFCRPRGMVSIEEVNYWVKIFSLEMYQ